MVTNFAKIWVGGFSYDLLATKFKLLDYIAQSFKPQFVLMLFHFLVSDDEEGRLLE